MNLEYLTITQVAELLQVIEAAVRAWIFRKQLAAHKVGRLIRISRSDLEAFIKRVGR
jgi:excisionase family DNA binding protein